MRRDKPKTPFYRRWWVWLLVLALCWTVGFTLGRLGVGVREQGAQPQLTIHAAERQPDQP